MKKKLTALVTVQAAAQKTKSCFTQSPEAYGIDLGIQESDFSTLTKTGALTAAHRIKAITICESTDKEHDLIGIQLHLGVAHEGQFYDSITLRSFGNTVNKAHNCKDVTVTPGQGIYQVELLYDPSGLTGANFLMSDANVAITGGKVPVVGSSKLLTFTPEEQLIGLWGLERYSVSKIGVITLDTVCAIKNLPAWTPPSKKPKTPVEPKKPDVPVKPADKPVTPTPAVPPQDDTSMIVMAVLVTLAGLGLIIGGIFGIKILIARKDAKEKIQPTDQPKEAIAVAAELKDEESHSRMGDSQQNLLSIDVGCSEIQPNKKEPSQIEVTISDNEPKQDIKEPENEPSYLLQSVADADEVGGADFIDQPAIQHDLISVTSSEEAENQTQEKFSAHQTIETENALDEPSVEHNQQIQVVTISPEEPDAAVRVIDLEKPQQSIHQEEPELRQVVTEPLLQQWVEVEMDSKEELPCDGSVSDMVIQENQLDKNSCDDGGAMEHRNAWVDDVKTVDDIKTVDTYDEVKTDGQSVVMLGHKESSVEEKNENRQYSYDTPKRSISDESKVLTEDMVIMLNDSDGKPERGRPVSQNGRNFWYTMDKPDILIPKQKKFREKSKPSKVQQSADAGQVLMPTKVTQKDYLDLVQVLKNLQEKKSLNHLSKLDEKLLKKIKGVVANNPEHYSSKTGYLQLVYNQRYKDI